MKSNAVLPQVEVDVLRELRESGNIRELRARVLALRGNDWPLRAIGDPLDVTRMCVFNWHNDASNLYIEDISFADRVDALTAEVAELPTPDLHEQLRARRVYLKVPDPDASRLRALAPEAAKLRGRSGQDSPARVATREFESLINKHVTRGVTPMDVARAAGVTRRTIAIHLEKIAAAA